MTTPAGGYDIAPLTGTSPPIDLSFPIPLSSLNNKTILITGGASGIGAGFAVHWASHGANIIIADICDPSSGEAFVSSLPDDSPGQKHHFFHCDVTVWQSQLRLFQDAVRASPTGGLDAVVANAGVPERNVSLSGKGFEDPVGLDDPDAPAPELKVLQTNMIGVAYTAHLACYWLPRNTREGGDRHLLFIGSIAGITPLPGQPEYCAAKHAVTGLWRAMSGSCGLAHGMRVNLLLPYFTDTPLVPWKGMMFLAGSGWAEVRDVVEAGTRMMADESIRGKALAVGTAVRVGRDGEVVGVFGKGGDEGDGEGRKDQGGRREAVWEVMARDSEHVEAFVWRFVRMMNAVVTIRGWVGFLGDCVTFAWFRRREEDRKAAKRREERKRA